MILLLLHALLFAFVLPVFSLTITVPTRFKPRVNGTALIPLTWSPGDPSHFFIAVRRSNPSDVMNLNFTTSIQPVDDFSKNRDVSLVFLYPGTNFIEAFGASSTEANVNVTFAQSEPFQVDDGPTGGILASSAADVDFSSPTSSATISSTVTSSLTASASATSSNPHKAAIIAGVVCGAFLLALVTTILLIWRYRKRRSRAPSRAFLNDLDDKRQPRTSRNDRSLNDPPPPYSPRISRAASKLFRWARGDDDSAASKTP